ncbi:unnamed protein product, partial [Protopolystoma xenopodis]
MLEASRPEHGGVYICEAENEAGRDTVQTILTVFEPHITSHMPQNITVHQVPQTGNINFSCTMNSTPPAIIQWYKDNVKLEAALHSDYYLQYIPLISLTTSFFARSIDRYSISPDGATLHLINISINEQGQYKCVAINIPIDVDYEFRLDVTTWPMIVTSSSSPNQMEVQRDGELRLQCVAKGIPEPTYQWMKEEVFLGRGGLSGTSTDPGQSSVNVAGQLTLSGASGTRYFIEDQGRLLRIV